jgi:hypothetical protein
MHFVLQDSLEFKPDGHVSMLGKSLRGDYVFSSEGDLIKAGQTTSFFKVGFWVTNKYNHCCWVYVMVFQQMNVRTCNL